MNEVDYIWATAIGGLVAVFVLTLLLLLGYEDYTPNYDAIEEVTDYYNTTVACDSEWIELCNQYKQEKNVEFDCFNKKWWAR